jgi:hypothetical protein
MMIRAISTAMQIEPPNAHRAMSFILLLPKVPSSTVTAGLPTNPIKKDPIPYEMAFVLSAVVRPNDFCAMMAVRRVKNGILLPQSTSAAMYRGMVVGFGHKAKNTTKGNIMNDKAKRSKDVPHPYRSITHPYTYERHNALTALALEAVPMIENTFSL